MKKLILLLSCFLITACDANSTGSDSCGDGVVDVGEQCDGDNLGGDTCVTLGYNGGTLTCDDRCSLVVTACEAEGSCGDGIVQTEYNEECEAGVSTDSCEELEKGTGTAVCDANCRYDFSGCIPDTVCGDGTIEGDEECEGSDLDDTACTDLGYYGGTLTCDGNCYFDLSNCASIGRCGDNSVQTTWGEECDGDDLQNASCESFGYHGGILVCSNDSCLYDFSDCIAVGMCGDDIVQTTAGEECDGTNLQGASCESLGQEYGGTLACDQSCGYNLSGCLGSCGDGIIQGDQGEDCEGTDFGGATCEVMGYSMGGNLACDQCQIDTSGCLQFTQLSAGFSHACALTLSGAAYCWGKNDRGQLGNGTTTNRLIPTAVQGGITFAQISAGTTHTCGRTAGGTIYCWGENTDGRLGDNTHTDRTVPTAISGTFTYTAVSAGMWHTCALRSTGAAYCWGNNQYGQLGDSSTTDKSIPTAVDTTIMFAQLQVGGFHTCALTSGGAAHCWGLNASGQLGDGTTTTRLVPVVVQGGRTFTRLGLGHSHTCGLTAGGAAYCWGKNTNGRLGDDTTVDRPLPTAVLGGLSFSDIGGGDAHTCGITTGGAAYCWGLGAEGALGNNTTVTSRVPTAVAGGLIFSSISVKAGRFSCALTTPGSPYCWGLNDVGQIGDGTTTTRLVPTAVAPY